MQTHFRRINLRHLCLDVLLLTLIAIPLTNGFVAGQALRPDFVLWGDTPWYLNRSMLIQHGIWPEAFVYTLGYPATVSLLQVFTGNLLAAALLVSRIALWAFIVGTYVVGHLYFSRRVGYLACLLVICSTLVRWQSRHLQPHMLFYATIVGIAIGFWLMLRYPGVRSAVLMGLIINFSFFTRFEGIAYSVTLPLAGLLIYRLHGWKAALKVLVVSGGLIAIGFIYYMSILLPVSDPNYAGSFSLLSLFLQNPIPVDQLLLRVTQTYDSLTIIWGWPVWVLAIVAGLWGWRRAESSLGYLICLGVIGLNLFILYVLATAPHYRLVGPVYPFVAILFVDLFIQLGRRFPTWRYAFLLPIIILAVPELFVTMRLSVRPAPDLTRYPEYQAAMNLDQELIERGWADREIFTFCREVVPFSGSHLHLMYRLAFRDENTPDNWNSPENLFARMASSGALFMTCPTYTQYVYWRDWKDWLEGKVQLSYDLQAVAEIGEFTLFQAVPHKSSTVG